MFRILNCKWTTGAGLAGLRVGYGAFPLSIIEYLWRAKQPYNVSVAAEISACAALQNPTYLEVNSCPIGIVHIYANKLCLGMIKSVLLPFNAISDMNQQSLNRKWKIRWYKKGIGYIIFLRKCHFSIHIQAILTSFFVRLHLEWMLRCWRYAVFSLTKWIYTARWLCVCVYSLSSL